MDMKLGLSHQRLILGCRCFENRVDIWA